MEQFIERCLCTQLVYVTDTDGDKITRNITQKVERGLYAHFGVGENFADREWFIAPMKTGKPHVTDFYTSRITHALCITVSAPIRNEGEEIVGIFAIDLKFELLAKMGDCPCYNSGEASVSEDPCGI